MSSKASSLKSSIEDFIRRQGIDAEMDQNLVKEANGPANTVVVVTGELCPDSRANFPGGRPQKC